MDQKGIDKKTEPSEAEAKWYVFISDDAFEYAAKAYGAKEKQEMKEHIQEMAFLNHAIKNVYQDGKEFLKGPSGLIYGHGFLFLDDESMKSFYLQLDKYTDEKVLPLQVIRISLDGSNGKA